MGTEQGAAGGLLGDAELEKVAVPEPAQFDGPRESAQNLSVQTEREAVAEVLPEPAARLVAGGPLHAVPLDADRDAPQNGAGHQMGPHLQRDGPQSAAAIGPRQPD